MKSILAILVVCLTAAPVAAQSANPQADALFKQARALMAQKMYPEACTAFAASQKLDPAVTTQLNLAQCREKNGELATAWGLFLDVQRQTQGAADAVGKQLNNVANDKATKLEPRLSKLTIAVATRPAGVVVLRDGAEVVDATWGIALPIDGGTHTITATAPGHVDWKTTITLGAEKDAQTVTVPDLGSIPDIPTVASSPPRDVAPAAVPLGAPEDRVRSRVLPLSFAGGAIAFAGVSLGFELSARHTNGRVSDSTSNSERTDLWNSANRRRYIATGLGVGALACAGIALYLWLHDTAGSTAQRTHQFVPLASADAGGISFQTSF